jgi:hypothetical protein
MPCERTEWMCGRCGSSISFEECEHCGGEGVTSHDCGEDCCCCLDPEDNVACGACGGSGAFPLCLSSPEWCEGHPLPGREATKCSTPESFTVQARIEALNTEGGELWEELRGGE